MPTARGRQSAMRFHLWVLRAARQLRETPARQAMVWHVPLRWLHTRSSSRKRLSFVDAWEVAMERSAGGDTDRDTPPARCAPVDPIAVEVQHYCEDDSAQVAEGRRPRRDTHRRLDNGRRLRCRSCPVRSCAMRSPSF